MRTIIRTYDELMSFETFEERFEYLKIGGQVGEVSFGFDRILNQNFYQSVEWKKVRRDVIARDLGCDLGIEDRPIQTGILVHHMNPIMIEDVEDRTEYLLNPDFLITTRKETHRAIHYGDSDFLKIFEYVERKPNDTAPWR